MAYQALYRKYRPSSFSEIIGQDHISLTLKKELALGKIFHAYLFTGTRGTGKTSCAKILAKAVNCLSPIDGDPCGECAACKAIAQGENTDVAEIDAASNNGVDDIRQLRDQINFIPADSKYRVYIIDEVHMLSESAFNALLKTLEEPPAHVIFVLATTEVHKLPATILSRCQRFDFHRIDTNSIVERLFYVAQKENLKLTNEAATLIAAAADGGMRDALSILDLCVSAGSEIDEKTVMTACGMAGRDYLFSLADAIRDYNSEDALLLLDKLYASSIDMLRLLNDLTTHYRNLMIIKTVKGESKPIVCSASHLELLKKQADTYTLKDIMRCLALLNETLSAMQNGNRRLQAEMAIIRLCSEDEGIDIEAIVKRVEALERGIKPTFTPPAVETPVAPTFTPPAMPTLKAEKPPKTEPKPEATTNSEPIDVPDGKLAIWDKIIKELAITCPPSIGILDGSEAYIKGDLLMIDAKNPMFRNMMNSNAAIRSAIKRTVENHLHKVYRLGPYVKEDQKPTSITTETDPLAALADSLKNLNLD